LIESEFVRKGVSLQVSLANLSAYPSIF
jgi:hypothetical protein